MRLYSNGLGAVYGVEDAAQANLICESSLSSQGMDILESGGIVQFLEKRPLATRVWKTSSSGEGRVAIGDMRSVAERCPHWEERIAALVLVDTMTDLGVETIASKVVFVGPSSSEGQAIEDSVVAAGYDPSFVERNVGAVSIKVPPEVAVAMIAVCLLAGLVGGSTTRSHARALRAYAEGLVAVGVSRAWARSVLIFQSAIVLSSAIVLAIAATTVPLLLGVMAKGIFVAVPWLYGMLIIGAVVLLATLSVAVSMRRVTPRTTQI